ncbi:MAG TPA: glycosyltransferase [Stellaceae bacterium]|jgi:glycosyltransferase involved in cell wall biosynthesis|nr:glycosyltransferase [Stellaceae bacterium]
MTFSDTLATRGLASLQRDEPPLVSVICFCKDRVDLIRRGIDSVLGQTYRNIEFVVQDAASTDGTLELLQEYAARDPRVKIVSEPDSGPAEGFWKVLHRCQGDYIATCLSDEELVPDAVEKAVRWFAAAPELGAITCDGYTTDADGKVIGDFSAGDFDFVSYLYNKYCPFWPGSFFRRKALLDVGLDRSDWNIGCLEFEIWCRLATGHEVIHMPERVSKYAIHPGQLSNTPKNFHEHIENRLALIEKMFSRDGFFGDDQIGKLEAMINQLSLFEFHCRAHGLIEDEKTFAARIATLKKDLAKAFAEKGIRLGLRDILPAERQHSAAQKIARYWKIFVAPVPDSLRAAIPLKAKIATRNLIENTLFFLRYGHHYLFGMLKTGARAPLADEGIAGTSAHHYASVAAIYEGRGQIRQALEMWKRAEVLNDPMIDSLACQAILKLPGATYDSIAAYQQGWADRHAPASSNAAAPRFLPYDGRRKIRIGYHCSFMDSDTIRFIMRNVMTAHDRAHFDVIGYAPMKLPDDIASAFDLVRNTKLMERAKFVDLVRGDKIDVFVELSGFSPGHRFLEMASRMAPVQVSYLNHHGTSRLPNVDYILSDAICTPPGSDAQRTFSEEIYLLPDCLFTYDYSKDECPPIVDPPSRRAGFVTFGCFGSGGKINTQLIGWWAEIMRRVPNSRIVIQNPQLNPPNNQRFMIERFTRHGIDADRVSVRGGTDRMNLIRAYDQVDISLDTWPYCGGNTVAESLWQGVPVITCFGDRISSRYGASLLKAGGCPELIGETPEEYIEIAVALAQDPERLLFLRHNLRRLYQEHGLGDSGRFARQLEDAYRSALTKLPASPARQ